MESLEDSGEVTIVAVQMPVERHKRLKIVAAKEGKTIKEIINGLVEAWVAKKEGA